MRTITLQPFRGSTSMKQTKEGRTHSVLPAVSLRPRPTKAIRGSLFPLQLDVVDTVSRSDAAQHTDLPDFLLLPQLQQTNNSPRPLLMKAKILPSHVLPTLKRKGSPICEELTKDTLSVISDETVNLHDYEEVSTQCLQTPKKRSHISMKTSPPRIQKVTPHVYEFQRTAAQLPLLPFSL